MKENKDKKRSLILTGGTLNKDLVREYLAKHKVDNIICVDGALKVVDELGLLIDYLVGDFDTVSSDLFETYRQAVKQGEKKITIRKFNPVKDETDTHIAILTAIEEGAEEIVLFGATGTRIDHMLANIHLLLQPLSLGIQAYIFDEHNKIYLIDKHTVIKKEELYGSYISLIPFGGDVTNVTLKGFKYDLESVDFKKGNSLGVSNELLEEQGEISFQSGVFAVFETRD